MENKKEKDSTKGLTIIVIILIFVVLILGSFIVYKEFIAKDTDKGTNPPALATPTPDVNKEEVLDINDATVQKLYGYFLYPNGTERGKHLGSSFFSKNMNVSTLSDEAKMVYAFNLLPTSAIVNQPLQANDFYRFTISEAAMDGAMKQFFGPNVTYNKNKSYAWFARYSFQPASIIVLEYKASSGQFEGRYSGSGDDLSPLLYGKLIGASKKGDTITLKEKYLIHDHGFNSDSDVWNQTIYKNDSTGNKVVIANKTVNVRNEEASLTQAEIDTYLNQGGTVTYTFKKDSTGNYYYESSTLAV